MLWLSLSCNSAIFQPSKVDWITAIWVFSKVILLRQPPCTVLTPKVSRLLMSIHQIISDAITLLFLTFSCSWDILVRNHHISTHTHGSCHLGWIFQLSSLQIFVEDIIYIKPVFLWCIKPSLKLICLQRGHCNSDYRVQSSSGRHTTSFNASAEPFDPLNQLSTWTWMFGLYKQEGMIRHLLD